MNRREIIKQGSVLGVLGWIVGINVVPTQEESNKDKLLELFAKTQGKTAIDALEKKLITEEEAKLIIEHTKEPEHAYELVNINKNNKEWAEKIIEKAAIGHPAHATYCMVRDHGSSREWAEKIIERATTGDPAYAAYCMTYYGSSSKWAEGVIERAAIRNVINVIGDAALMVTFRSSSEEWYEKIKAKHAKV